MQLTYSNYHSPQANQKYMSNSLLKSFVPLFGGCEAQAMARIRGEWFPPENDAFLVGGYVHAWNSGTMQEFIYANSGEMFRQDGRPYKKFVYADCMIDTLKNDKVIMTALTGDKEVILTGELYGMPWKVMVDVLNAEKGYFVDLKTCRSIRMTYYDPVIRERVNFIVYYRYDFQMAGYAEIIRQNIGGDYLEPHIVAVSKEDPPDKELIRFGTDFIQGQLDSMQLYAEHVEPIWRGRQEPQRCEVCAYCRETKIIKRTVHYTEL